MEPKTEQAAEAATDESQLSASELDAVVGGGGTAEPMTAVEAVANADALTQAMGD